MERSDAVFFRPQEERLKDDPSEELLELTLTTGVATGAMERRVAFDSGTMNCRSLVVGGRLLVRMVPVVLIASMVSAVTSVSVVHMHSAPATVDEVFMKLCLLEPLRMELEFALRMAFLALVEPPYAADVVTVELSKREEDADFFREALTVQMEASVASLRAELLSN